MHSSSVRMCSECNTSSDELFNGYHCHSCGRWVCHKCIKELVSHLAVESSGAVQNLDCEEPIKLCKFCGVLKISENVHPANSPRESPEPPSPSFSGESIQDDRLARYLESRDCGYSPLSVTCNNMTAIVPHPCLASVRCSRSRGGDEEQADDSDKHFHSPSNEYASDVDSSSMSSRLEFCSFKSVGSSPFDSPSSGTDFTSYSRLGHAVHQGQEDSPLSLRDGPLDQENMAVLRRPDTGAADPDNMDDCSDDLSASRNQYEKSQKPWDFESNGLIWSPPLPVDENDDAETNFFAYDDDDDYLAGDSVTFSASSSLSRKFSAKERDTDGDKEPLKFVIQGHFRALVSQLLQGEGIQVSGVDSSENWLDIVTSLAWQAANFVKPDTRRGGSMDPVDYVKVKCIASGIPIDSSLIKGVVCTKNIKHKRMTTQYKNPKLLLLGGALEYRSVTNQLASFNTLVQEENDHLKMIISKIEALRPNVLLVEKNVSPYAQEYLLTKEISLVPNVKKPLMERIARCTGALISPSIDTISTTRLGNCELFRVERFLEEHELANQFNKKPTKTLMFFEGCPRRLGCTVLLRGSCCDELKKVKDVVQYAVFAAYHLSLETSFLADEGASLPKMKIEQTVTMPADEGMPVVPLNSFEAIADYSSHDNGYTGSELVSENIDACGTAQSLVPVNNSFGDILPDICHMPLSSSVLNHFAICDCNELKTSRVPTLEASSLSKSELLDIIGHQQSQVGETLELEKSDRPDGYSVSNEYFLASDTYQSILVSFSSRCVPKGTVCERSRLLRIKFYGSFDKPLGRYLRDDLFDQTSFCRNCKEQAEAHVLCYTHQQGNLTINVRSLSSMKLPGEQDGKIWMWHRCLRCAHVDGVPPSTRRVIMSDAAWGLSFGKFLELSFSNHATADRVAPCGHSLQKDCLRFYGFGSMVGFFRYSPIDILNVHLPPSVLEFTGIRQQEWIRKEAAELLSKVEVFYSEISNVLDGLEERSKLYGSQLSEATELQNHILELKVQLMKERNNYSETLKLAVMESLPPGQEGVDILDLNRTRRSLIIDSRVWDRQIYSLDSLLKTSVTINPKQKVARQNVLMAGGGDSSCQEPLGSVGNYLQFEQGVTSHLVDQSLREDLVSSCHVHKQEDAHLDSETSSIKAITDDIACDASNLSDRIDSAWTGTDQRVIKVQELDSSDTSGQIRVATNSPLKRMMGPVRVNSFDSALRVQERIQKGMPLSNLRSFHASGDYRTMLRDPVSNTLRTSSQAFPLEVQKSNILLTTIPSFISSASDMMGGARLLLPHRTHSDVVIGVYDDDPASIVSYALNLKEHEDWVASNKSNDIEGKCNIGFVGREDSAASTISGWQSYGSMDLDYMNFGSDGISSSISNLFTDSKKSPHFGISYNDASGVGGKVKYSVTCYFANQFHSLRKKCCPSDVDFVRSLSRCQKWSAQGGKSNVYFAKSLDERFIIKQVKKTELESFEEFAPEYFKYVTESLNSRSPTCLAKILGIYQVAVKHLKSGRETKMDLMVMENLFFRRTISRVYDLKGSARSRYNPDSSGVLLDMNLVEELRTEPIFLGSKAKRSLERAIWNDTSFLASVDVMDYSLLVGVDEEKKELVLGIIDFMRQYTWDKHLETWVKASGILGGPKNASPTIISPVQYKKRFRKAMTSYFLTVPHQWSTS